MLKNITIPIFVLALSLIILLASILVGQQLINTAVGEKAKSQADRLELIAEARLNLVRETINDRISTVVFMSQTPPIDGIIRATANNGLDPVENTTAELWKERLGRIFVAYMQNNVDIFQLRFIGVADQGQELVRVDKRNGLLVVVDESLLQQKSDRDYFQEILTLDPNQHYVSRINLNQEFGRLEFPYRPTIRVAKPVLDSQGEMFGFIIANVDTAGLLGQVKDMPEGVSSYLTDEEGNFIAHPDPEKEFSFEFGKVLRLQDLFEPVQTGKYGSRLELLVAKQPQDDDLLGYHETLILNPSSPHPIPLNLMLAEKLSQWQAEVDTVAYKIWLLVFATAACFVVIIAGYQRHIRRQSDINIQLVQYQAIFDGSIDAVLSVDDKLRVINCNPAAVDLLREPSRLILGRSLSELLPATESWLEEQPVSARLQHKQAEQQEVAHVLADGKQLTLLVSLFKAFEKGEKALFGVIVKDNTETAAFQQAIQETNERLEQQVRARTAELQQETEKALKANATINSFVANISHELRTPINGIMGLLSVLRSKQLPEDIARRLAMAYRSSEGLLELVNNILDISKIEAGKVELDLHELDLHELISQLYYTLVVLVKTPDVQLLLDLSQVHHPKVIADGTRLKQVMTNLLSNAIKFTNKGEVRMAVSTQLTDTGKIQLHIEIADTGIGIASNKLGNLFEKFTQEDSSTTRQFGGTGLGLPIAKELTELMSGQITVESQKHQGTRFSLDFEFDSAMEQQNGKPDVLVGIEIPTIWLSLANKPLEGIIQAQLQSWGITVEVHAPASLNELDPQGCQQAWLLVAEAHFSPAYSEQFEQVMVLIADYESTGTSLIQGNPVRLLKPVTPLGLATALLKCCYAQPNVGERVPKPPMDAMPTEVLDQQLLDLSAHCILIVDDNELNLEVAAGLLEETHAQVIKAENGQQAIRQLTETELPVSAILMDCQMPVMDGYSATAEIRAGAAGRDYQDIPIIALTAGAMAGDKERCLGAGMNEYLAKPILKSKLLSKLAEVLEVDFIAANDSEVNLAEAYQGLAVLDADKALERLGGMESLWNKVVQVFQASYEEKLSTLEQALAADDSEKIKFWAHNLKGVCASTGLDRAAEICRLMEQQSTDTDRCAALHNDLCQAIAAAVIQLDNARA